MLKSYFEIADEDATKVAGFRRSRPKHMASTALAKTLPTS